MKHKCSPSVSRTNSRAIFVYLLMVAFIGLTFPRVGHSQTIKDIATDATDPNNLADTEPSIAVDPSNPLRIAIVSFSGPGDQKIAFDSTGRVLIAELDSGFDDFIYRQTGAPGTPLTAGASYGNDQPHLDVDKTAGSPCFNRVYSPWLNTAAAPARSNVERSPDFGVTVTAVPAGDPAFNNRATRIAVAPNGKAYIIFKTREGAIDANFENAHFRVERSDNCGVTWTGLGATGVAVHAGTAATWFTNNFGNPAKGKVGRARSSDAWISVDPSSGDIYAVFCNRDASGFGQVYLARSTNQGSTWSTTRVTDGTHHSAYPEVAVAANGTIGVLYIDFDDSGAATIFRHRLARSFNHGTNWTHSNLQSMNPAGLANASSGFLWGDYEGITAQGNSFYGVFTGQSIGRATVQLDPIFFTAPATQIIWPNFCLLHPEICVIGPIAKCQILGCVIIFPICEVTDCPICHGGGCLIDLIIDEVTDPYRVTLYDPKGNAVKAQQIRKGNQVTMRFRVSPEFANRVAEYSVGFKGGKPGMGINASIRAKAVQ